VFSIAIEPTMRRATNARFRSTAPVWRVAARALFGVAMAAGASHAGAADDDSALRFLIGGGLTYGGDSLVTSRFSDGSYDVFRAGGLVHLYGGVELKLTDRFAVQNNIGYQINEARVTSDARLRFTRYPIDIVGLYSLSDHIRLGGGMQLVASPELRGSGVASNISQKYKSTVGAIVEGEYLFNPHMGLKLRYVNETFKPKEGDGVNVDGSHAGIMFSYYF